MKSDNWQPLALGSFYLFESSEIICPVVEENKIIFLLENECQYSTESEKIRLHNLLLQPRGMVVFQ